MQRVAPSEGERVAIDFELSAMQDCAHKHVVELLGAADVGVDTYIAMERCQGDLMQFVTSPRQLSERTVAKMMRQVRRGAAQLP